MKHGKNTSNIEMVKNYLDGTRPFVQVGYKGIEDVTPKEIGEIWTDSAGKTWKQTNYGKSSHTPVMDMIRKETNVHCSDCKKEIRWGTKQDEKMFAKTGRCLDCLSIYETQLKLTGKWAAYEQKKLFENELSYIDDVRAKIKDGLDYTKANHTLTFVNSNGLVEEWDDNRRDELLKSLRKDHIRALKEMKRLKKEISSLDLVLNNN
jgi:hypothetical protein